MIFRRRGDRKEGVPTHTRPNSAGCHKACNVPAAALQWPLPAVENRSVVSPPTPKLGCGKAARFGSPEAAEMTALLPDSRSIRRQPAQPSCCAIKAAAVRDGIRGRRSATSRNLCIRPSVSQLQTASRKATTEMPAKYAEDDLLLITLHWRGRERYRVW